MKKPVEQSQTKYFLAENWKDLLGALSGLAAIIYGIGFLITNIFLLSEYDIYDFSILKARYIYVGAVFSMFLFISFWTADLIYNNQDKILPTKLQKYFIFKIIYVVVSSIFLGMAAGGLVKSLLIPLASFDRAGLGFTAIQMRIWMVLAILACYYVIWLLKSDFLKSNNAFPIPYSLFTAILIVSILYARLVYPFMPFSLGGGTPIVIKLVIVDEKIDQVNQIIPIESGNTTSTLYLVDQSELSYFILVPNNSAQNLMYPVEIKKDLVLGIVHQKDVAFLFLGSTELMPKVTPSESPTSEP
jgi:hypothetical protein